ncbi:NAA60 (predicted) [Pycnogonum litorale]
MTKKILLSGDSALQLRFLCPRDVDEVKELCTEWFPINYPDSWFKEIASNPNFYSLAAIYQHHIVGLIVSELKPLKQCSKEDRDILSPHFLTTAFVAYILTLGVHKEYRRNGIGSLLLDNLINHLVNSPETMNCKALYLHALTTNKSAIMFYECKNFKPHSYLPCYYSINGRSLDGFSYVLYVNNGYPPWNLLDCVRGIFETLYILSPCRIAKKVGHVLHFVCMNTVTCFRKII